MIASELAAWGIGEMRVPTAVSDAATRHLLDGVGNALAARVAGAAAPALVVARELGGPPEATVLGSTGQIGAPAAALANGTLVHALDFDDTHAGGLVHATAVVLPAALAIGEQVGATGAEVLSAAVVGYETACRVAAAAPFGFHRRGLHATMVAGTFSSALVAARLLRLDAVTATHALGIAGSQSGGLLAFLDTGASTKQLHPGFASHAGILAARLAAAGATGPETVFDGPHGVFDALAAGEIDAASITRGLGDHWETTRIGIKPYPACQLSHATLAAVAEVMHRTGTRAAEVVSVHAQVHPDSAGVVCAPGRDLASPGTPYAAKFSLPWSVAAMVHDGAITTATYTEDAIGRPEVISLARSVTWDVVDDRRTVAADAPGEVALTLSDGSVVRGHVDRSPGGGSNPLSQEALLAKLKGNLGRPAPNLVEVLGTLADQRDLGELFRLAASAVRDPGPNATTTSLTEDETR